MDFQQICDLIRQTGYDIRVYLGPGHLEKVYENAAAHRVGKVGLPVLQQHPIKVRDEDGTLIGEYFADLFVENCLIVEIKAGKALADEPIAQILGYMKVTGIKHGLQSNFGGPQYQIRKFIL